jgi:hypothetical protein
MQGYDERREGENPYIYRKSAREREKERESIRPQEFRDRKGAGSTGPKSVTNTNKSQHKFQI